MDHTTIGDSHYFDSIAEQYGVVDIGSAPVRRHSQVYTLLELAGSLEGKAVLELACSDGFFTRRLKAAGAERVVGADLSEKMITLAKASEAQRPLGIEYRVTNVYDLGVVGSFDLVVSSFLLHYAPDRDDLVEMCRILHANVKPGGRLISINDHPDSPCNSVDGFEKYGETKRIASPAEDGAKLTVTFIIPDAKGKEQRVAFDCNYFSRETLRWALEKAGFRDVTFHDPEVSPAGLEEYGREYWELFFEHPLHVYIECCK
jgi:SAM-dependent methyltransferase